MSTAVKLSRKIKEIPFKSWGTREEIQIANHLKANQPAKGCIKVKSVLEQLDALKPLVQAMLVTGDYCLDELLDIYNQREALFNQREQLWNAIHNNTTNLN